MAQFIAEAQAHLYGASGPIITTLTSSINSGATAVVVGDGSGLGPRRVLSMDDELMYVTAWNSGTLTATVVRGFRGTTPASHSSGSLIEVNPRYPQYRIRQEIANEINSWPDSLFTIGYADITTNATARGYDLPAGDFIRVLDTYLSPSIPTATEVWTRINAHVRRTVPTTDFPSGVSVTLPSYYAPARTVRVVYAKRFTTTDMSDGITCGTIGLWPSMVDIPALGAAAAMVQDKEVRRIDLNAQGQNRSAEQVQVGASSATSRAYRVRADTRINQEAIRLAARYPLRVG